MCVFSATSQSHKTLADSLRKKMTEPEKNKDDLLSKLKYEPIDFMKYLPVHTQIDIKKSEIYTDFLICYLIKKRNGIRKIDQLVLDANKADISFEWFVKKQNATEFGYAEIIKQTDKYIKLKITEKGIDYFKYSSVKYRTKSITHIKRISLYVLKLISKLISFVFVSAPKYIKIAMESGIAKLILFVIAVIGILLKWEEIKTLIHTLTKK